jgi:hypothetical protein
VLVVVTGMLGVPVPVVQVIHVVVVLHGLMSAALAVDVLMLVLVVLAVV